MAEPAKIVTGIGKAELHRILVRGYDLNKELVGKITFTDMTSRNRRFFRSLSSQFFEQNTSVGRGVDLFEVKRNA
jgi:hypothetical protein